MTVEKMRRAEQLLEEIKKLQTYKKFLSPMSNGEPLEKVTFVRKDFGAQDFPSGLLFEFQAHIDELIANLQEVFNAL